MTTQRLDDVEFERFRPPNDPVLEYLLEEAVQGGVSVFFAAIPPGLIDLFDPNFKPDETEDGQRIVEAIMTAWRRNEFIGIWVYPRRGQFVSSDDYLVMAAIRRGEPALVPCWVLGNPRAEGVTEIRGPMTKIELQHVRTRPQFKILN